jgi:Domain of unknown function (DUF4476)
MKKLITSFIFVFTIATIFAQTTSNLTISTTGTSNLKIRFANKKYSLMDRSLTFQSLNPGSYALTIYQLQNKPFGGGTEYVTVFDKTITLTAQKHMEVCVLRFGKVAWDEKQIERDNWNENYQNPEPDRDRDGGWRNGNGGYGNNNRNAVDAANFEKMKDAIVKQVYDDDKLTMAKVVMKNNWYTTAQLKSLTEKFVYDDNKLAFAKYAYDFCIDPGNYYTVADALVYQASKQELLKFIAGK